MYPVKMNSNAEAMVAQLIGMQNVEEPTAPNNVVETYLNFVLENGGVIEKPRNVELVGSKEELLTLENPMEGVIYLVSSSNPSDNNVFDEYMYVNEEVGFEIFGSVTLKLVDDSKTSTQYAYSSSKTTKVVNDAKNDLIELIDALTSRVSELEVTLDNLINPNTPPVFNGVEDKTIEFGAQYYPKTGVTATDMEDGDLTGDIEVTGNLNVNVAGEYPLSYRVEDSRGLEATASRVITVLEEVIVEPEPEPEPEPEVVDPEVDEPSVDEPEVVSISLPKSKSKKK